MRLPGRRDATSGSLAFAGRTHVGATAGVAALAAGVVAVAVIAASGVLVAPASGAQPAGASSRDSVTGATPASTPTATPWESPTPPAPPLEPLVPVVSFWSPPRDIALTDVARLWAGNADTIAATHFESVVISASAANPLARAFGTPAGVRVRVLPSAEVTAAVRASPTTLGVLPAEDVGPQVRALSVDGVSLFGSARAKDLAEWPLVVAWPTATAFSPDTEWTLAAGGDVNLDRRVYQKAVAKAYGPDFPWSAGYAAISGYEGGGFEGRPLVVARDRGPAGALRQKLSTADLTLVNLEGPAPNDFVPRFNDLVFTFDPALLIGLRDAGIDAVTLANNHIRNGGDRGVVETCQNLDKAGLAHTGAGVDVSAARRPAWLQAGGLRVAVLGYSAINQNNWATADRAGAAPLDVASVTADIRAARAAGADVVIVMPHWGQEYTYYLSREQKAQAAAFVDAGADLVLGSHSHWVGAIQAIDRPGGPAFVAYSLGDLLFDLNHEAASQEAVIVTLTFSGTRLVQVELAPTVMIDGAQVGLLDPAGQDGARIVAAIQAASKGLPGWSA
jgi:poly-gamma-glutamate capsule biosynthesis protein CapA/YwtB (metallophosphatase superfamily)